ncbi:MAG: hypothetical protein ACLR23_16020 [Clostridia bacterium]
MDAIISAALESASVVCTIRDHTFSTEWKSDVDGHWHECTVCGTKADTASHTYGDWEIVKSATETETGEQHHTCTACGYVERAETPVLEHTHSYGTEWKSDNSNHWHECACGEKSDMAAHTYGDWTVTKAATAATAGSRERSCTVCGFKVVETIASSNSTPADRGHQQSHTMDCPASAEPPAAWRVPSCIPESARPINRAIGVLPAPFESRYFLHPLINPEPTDWIAQSGGDSHAIGTTRTNAPLYFLIAKAVRIDEEGLTAGMLCMPLSLHNCSALRFFLSPPLFASPSPFPAFTPSLLHSGFSSLLPLSPPSPLFRRSPSLLHSGLPTPPSP